MPKIFAHVLHPRIDFDDTLAAYLFATRGEEKFPGSATACFTFWRKLPEGWTATTAKNEGYNLIGIGHGEFDEHLPARVAEEREADTCAAIKVAQRLGCANDPIIAKLLEYALTSDNTTRYNGKFQLPALIKMIATYHGDQRALAWSHQLFAAIEKVGERAFKILDQETGSWFESMLSIWLLTRFGEKILPGVQADGSRMLENGYPGPVEKAFPRSNESELFSAAIAGKLLLSEDAGISKMLEFARKRMCAAVQNALDIHILLQIMYASEATTAKVYQWAMLALDAVHASYMEFVRVADDFAKATVTEIQAATIKDSRKGCISTKLAYGFSNSTEFARYARTQGCGVVVQFSNKGILIATQQGFGIDLTEVVQLLRGVENHLRGNHPTNDHQILAQTGHLTGCEVWYFPSYRGAIFNGTPTKWALPTIISHDMIIDLVVTGLNPQRFDQARQLDCQLGQCTSGPKNQCLLYAGKLFRCRQIRFYQRSQRSKHPHLVQIGK